VAPIKKWAQATNERGEQCRFGFAEYEDPEGLGCAVEVLKDLKIPAIDGNTEDAKLMVLVPLALGFLPLSSLLKYSKRWSLTITP
jgi:hypothetical protein